MSGLRFSGALAALSSLLALAACGADDNKGGAMQQPGNVGAPAGMATGTGGSAAPSASGTGGTTPTMTMTMAGTGGTTGTTMMGTGGTTMMGTGGTTMAGSGGMSSTGIAGMGTAPAGGGDISSCPAPPASATPEVIAALNAVNTLRLASGSGCAKDVEELNTSAQKHCEYYAANASDMMCIADPHSEVASCMSFYGASVGDRIKAAGYMARGYSEVMAFDDDPQAAIDQWINSVWHRIPLLDPWTTELGYGHAAKCDTIDLGSGASQAPNDTVVVYPYDGETDVPTEFNGMYEGPMPPAPPSGWPSGPPINVYAKMISITDHVVTKDGDTTPIDHVWLTGMDQSATAQFLRNGVMMYPNVALTAMTKYRVRVKGTYVGGALDLEWTFTTGAAPTWPPRR